MVVRARQGLHTQPLTVDQFVAVVPGHRQRHRGNDRGQHETAPFDPAAAPVARTP